MCPGFSQQGWMSPGSWQLSVPFPVITRLLVSYPGCQHSLCYSHLPGATEGRNFHRAQGHQSVQNVNVESNLKLQVNTHIDSYKRTALCSFYLLFNPGPRSVMLSHG